MQPDGESWVEQLAQQIVFQLAQNTKPCVSTCTTKTKMSVTTPCVQLAQKKKLNDI